MRHASRQGARAATCDRCQSATMCNGMREEDDTVGLQYRAFAEIVHSTVLYSSHIPD